MEDVISITDLTEEYSPKEEDYVVIENEEDGTRKIPISVFNPKSVIKIKSITAVYTQTSDVYVNTPLDSLRSSLVVTEKYSDGSTKTITNYSLDGELAVGTSVVTVTYKRFTDTFNVTVTREPTERTVANWNFVNPQNGSFVFDTINGYELTKANPGYTTTMIDGTMYVTLDDPVMKYLKFPTETIFDFDKNYTSLIYKIKMKEFWGKWSGLQDGNLLGFSDNWEDTSERRIGIRFNYAHFTYTWIFNNDIEGTSVEFAEGQNLFNNIYFKVALKKTSATTMTISIYQNDTLLYGSGEISKTDFEPFKNAFSFSNWQKGASAVLENIQVIEDYATD